MLFGLFGRKKEEKQEVYCQACGKELTDEGGDVTNTKKIYCNGYKPGTLMRCIERDMIENPAPGVVVIGNYQTPKQVQKSISKGKLTEFGSLEIKASSN